MSSQFFKERYQPYLMGVNSSVVTTGQSIGGFLCKTAGTLTVTSRLGVLIVDAHPVTAGTYYPLPFFTHENAVVQLAGGASGTLGV